MSGGLWGSRGGGWSGDVGGVSWICDVIMSMQIMI